MRCVLLTLMVCLYAGFTYSKPWQQKMRPMVIATDVRAEKLAITAGDVTALPPIYRSPVLISSVDTPPIQGVTQISPVEAIPVTDIKLTILSPVEVIPATDMTVAIEPDLLEIPQGGSIRQGPIGQLYKEAEKARRKGDKATYEKKAAKYAELAEVVELRKEALDKNRSEPKALRVVPEKKKP